MEPTPHELARFDRQVVRSRRSDMERGLAYIAIDNILDEYNEAKARQEAKILSELETALKASTQVIKVDPNQADRHNVPQAIRDEADQQWNMGDDWPTLYGD